MPARCLAIVSLIAWLGFLLQPVRPAIAADSSPPIRVLIITGDSRSPDQDWLSCAVATREVLLESRDFQVSVIGSATVLENEPLLARFDVIYFSLFNARTPTISDQAKENLLQFVRSGKGLVVSHLASASFMEWDEFKRLCGRAWLEPPGEGIRSVFRAKIADAEHPITKGLADFQQDDQLYNSLQGEVPIRVLVQTRIDPDREAQPVAFVLPYGQGRVFHHLFGHDAKAITNPTVKTLIVRGTAWAAGRLDR